MNESEIWRQGQELGLENNGAGSGRGRSTTRSTNHGDDVLTAPNSHQGQGHRYHQPLGQNDGISDDHLLYTQSTHTPTTSTGSRSRSSSLVLLDSDDEKPDNDLDSVTAGADDWEQIDGTDGNDDSDEANNQGAGQWDEHWNHTKDRNTNNFEDDFNDIPKDAGAITSTDAKHWKLTRGGSVFMDPASEDYSQDWQQAGENADALDLAGPGAHGKLEISVTKPQKENEGTQNQFISYLVSTHTDFKSFQRTDQSVRRRFTDFVFLQKTLTREYPQCAVPPIPDKHKMEYVRGDRFGPDFTARRAYSLQRFLKRLTLHPVLRRAVLLTLFLESTDWNATMRSRPSRGMSTSEPAPAGVLETWTDSFLNAFTKPHKADRRFLEVRDRADKLDEDLATVSKSVTRLVRRESDLESDYSDLATQFQKLAQLEPGVQNELTGFASSIETTAQSWKAIRDFTDQDYMGSLRDMEAYITSLKLLLKTREQKQLDFEALTEYLTKAANERDSLASGPAMGASGFIRAKIEDVRGVDHESARRERVRKLEVQIRRLQDEVEGAKKTSEAFDEEVVKEVADFERIKAVEFRDTLGGVADANCAFFNNTIETWEKFIRDMEAQDRDRGVSVA